MSIIQLTAETLEAVEQKVVEYRTQLASLEPRSGEGQRLLRSITKLGATEMRSTADLSARLLAQPMSQLANDDDPIGIALAELYRVFKTGLMSERSKQTQLQSLIRQLETYQHQLQSDNALLEEEQQHLHRLMETLARYHLFCQRLEAPLNQYSADITQGNIFPQAQRDLQQRQHELSLHQVVNEQGYLTLTLLLQHNREVICRIEQILTTTVSALSTASLIAQSSIRQSQARLKVKLLGDSMDTLIETDQSHLNSLQLDCTQGMRTVNDLHTFKRNAMHQVENTLSHLASELDKTQTASTLL